MEMFNNSRTMYLLDEVKEELKQIERVKRRIQHHQSVE